MSGTSRRLRGIGTLVLAVGLAAACASTSVTPSSSSRSLSPSAEPSASAAPSSTAGSTSNPSNYFDVLMGKAKPLQPGADKGVAAANALNDFGLDMLRKLDSRGNLCVSPTSIALALALLQPGARGQTAAEMDKVLHGFGSAGNAASLAALMVSLRNGTVYSDGSGFPWGPDLDASGNPVPGQTPPSGLPPLAELTLSNQAFAQKGLQMQPAYLDALSSRFGAGVGLLDFATDPDGATKTINKWASDKTHGRIPNVLQPGDVDRSTLIALANAIYLKAAWGEPFDPAQTKPAAFHKADGSTVSVPTMANTLLASYAAGKGWRAMDMWLSNSLQVTFVLPDQMAAFEAGLTSAEFRSITGKESLHLVHLAVPKFSIESRFELASALEAMGMPSAFDASKADLSGIDGQKDIHLGSVVHQANIDVVEEGVTAAAVTVEAGGAGAMSPPVATFHLDHPFLYFVRDYQSGAILFMGRVDDPSAKK